MRNSCSKEKLQEVLDHIHADAQHRHFVNDYDSLFGNLHISKFSSIAKLNKLTEKINSLEEHDYKKPGAILKSKSCASIAEILKISNMLDSFNLLDGVDDDEALREYYADCGCIF